MKKRLWNLLLVSASFPVFVSAGCQNTNKKDNNTLKPEQNKPNTPNKNENQNQTETDKELAEIKKGGELNGLTSDKFKSIIDILELQKKSIVSMQLNKIKPNNKAELKIEKIEIVSYDDEKGFLEIKANFLYKNKKIENEIIKIEGFSNSIDQASLIYEIDKNLIIEKQLSFSQLSKLENSSLLDYFNKFNILINNFAKVNLKEENDNVKVNTIKISKTGSDLNLVVDVNYQLIKMSNNKVEKEKEISLLSRKIRISEASLMPKSNEILDYIIENKLEEKDDINTSLNNYPSYFVGLSLADFVDGFASKFFKINNKYEKLSNKPIHIIAGEAKANDITGDLYMTIKLRWFNNTNQSVESKYVYKKISNFKKTLNDKSLEKDFTINFNNDNLSKDNAQKIADEFNKSADQNNFKIVKSDEIFKTIFHNEDYLVLGSNVTYKENTWYRLLYKGTAINKDNYDYSGKTEILSANHDSLQINKIQISPYEMKNFKIVTDNGTKLLEFVLLAKISVTVYEAQNATSSANTKTFEWTLNSIHVVKSIK